MFGLLSEAPVCTRRITMWRDTCGLSQAENWLKQQLRVARIEWKPTIHAAVCTTACLFLGMRSGKRGILCLAVCDRCHLQLEEPLGAPLGRLLAVQHALLSWLHIVLLRPPLLQHTSCPSHACQCLQRSVHLQHTMPYLAAAVERLHQRATARTLLPCTLMLITDRVWL